MNKKRAFKSDVRIEYLHEVDIESGSKTYHINKHTQLSLVRAPGRPAGRYEFLYAERAKDGTLLLTVEGRMSQPWEDRRRKVIREDAIKTVHIKTRVRD